MANPSFNWMVPLRRAVVQKAAKYSEFMAAWLDELRVDDHAFVLGLWYTDDDDEPFSLDDYNRGLASLNHWWKVTFGEIRVATSSVGITTIQTKLPNYHARFWKGPKRVLREQAAAGDPETLAEIQPFDLVGGQIQLRLDEDKKPKEIELLPGDVLEVPLHVFLYVCGQKRFEDVAFDPQGSFYLGTTVKSKSGKPRIKLPLLHDNMLAMRLQLLTALNMANCYHDEPVYTRLSVPSHAMKPEGAGVFARGMPFGGNSVSSLIAEGPAHWRLSQYNTNIAKEDRPIYVPTWDGLDSYARGQPVTWGWTCSPFALFFFTLMADAHKTRNGIFLPGSLRQGSLAQSICMSASSMSNKTQLQSLTEFEMAHPGDPLLLHNLEVSDIFLPREQTPLADLCEIVLPEGKEPLRPVFSDPNGDRIRRIPLPADGAVDTYEWDKICPGAGVIVQSSGAGHEFGLVRLYPLDKIMTDAIASLSPKDADPTKLKLPKDADPTKLKLPIAGRLGAYNPLSGEDYCAALDVGPKGLFFINESAAKMPPSEGRGYYSKHMALSGVNIHKFRFTRENSVQFMADGKSLLINDGHEDASTKKKKKRKETFRNRPVSGIFFIIEGVEGDPNPRTLSNIYGIRRESWPAIALRPPDHNASQSTTDFLAKFQPLYAERAVPFPTLLEAAPGLPSWERVFKQLENHRDRIMDLPNQVSTLNAQLSKRLAEIDAENAAIEQSNKGKPKSKQNSLLKPDNDSKVKDLRGQLKLAQDADLRRAFLNELPPKSEEP